MAETPAYTVLAGTWEGEGKGHYPTIEPFGYRERVTFEPVADRPFLAYRQLTRHASDGRPLHAESGWLRGGSRPDEVELLIAQPTGIVEVYEGRLDGRVLDLRATTIGRTATAKPVTALRRRLVVAADLLTYDLWMAHADTPQSHHLHAELRRS